MLPKYRAKMLTVLRKIYATGVELITVGKIRSRKIRTDVGKFSFVNRTIADWNRLPEGAIGTLLVKAHILRKRVRKVYQ
jgi:hypothetical protein